MDSFGGGYFVDEKAVRVENIFLEFLKRSFFFLDSFDFLCLFWYIYIYICVVRIIRELVDLNQFGYFFYCFSYRAESNPREIYYESEIEAMKPNESNTMFIDFSHVMNFNDVLQKAISEEYLR